MPIKMRGSGRPLSKSEVALAVALGAGLTLGAGGLLLGSAGLALWNLSQQPTRKPPLTAAQWRAALGAGGRVAELEAVLDTVRTGGVEEVVRAEVWPHLLRVWPPGADAQQRASLAGELEARYRGLLRQCQYLEAQVQQSAGPATGAGAASPRTPASPASPAGQPATCGSQAEADKSSPAAAATTPRHLLDFAEAQRIIVLDAIRTDLLQPSQQAAAASAPASAALPTPGPDGASVALPAWVSPGAREQLEAAAHLTPAGRRQAARLVNLLSAYAVHDLETGYCQGMSDLAAPFLLVFEHDDALAFWCFERLMRKAKRNFRHDEAGIRLQLAGVAQALSMADGALLARLRRLNAAECFFAYRMVIVMLRRELPLSQVMTLWEVLWAEDLSASLSPAGDGAADRPAAGKQGTASQAAAPSAESARLLGRPADAGAPDLLTCFIAAVVLSQRAAIMRTCNDVDDVLRLFSGVEIDLWQALAEARRLRQLCQPAR